MRGLLLAFGFLYTLFIQESLSGQTTPSLSTITFPKYSIEKYSLESGLSNPRVKCLLEHSSGFLYVGTEFGLNRFDGYEFKVFDDSHLSTPRLSGSNVARIKEVWDGNILLTYGRGRDSFDVINPYSLALHVVSTTSKTGFKGVLAQLATDIDKNPYLLSYDFAGLYIYLLQRDFTLKSLGHVPQSMDFTKANLTSLEFFRFKVQQVGQDTFFWISNKIFGLLKVQFKSGNPVVQQIHPPLHVKWKPYLWDLDKDGIIRFEEPFRHLRYNVNTGQNGPEVTPTDWYACFGFLDENNNWLLAGAKRRVLEQYEEADGFRIMLTSGKELEVPFPFAFEWNTQLSVSSRNFEKYFWVGTFDGLRKITLQPSNVRQWLVRDVADGLYGNRMRGIMGNALGNMVCLTETGAAYFRSGQDGVFQPIPGKWSSGRSVTLDALGNFWCTAQVDKYGLVRIDAMGKRVDYYAKDILYAAHTQTRSGQILAARMARELEGKGGGLDILDPATGRMERFITADGNDPLVKLSPNCLLEDRNGQIWIGCSKGLFRVDLSKRTSQKFAIPNQAAPEWVNKDINVILEMPGGTLMLGTSTGLILLEPQTGDFESYTTQNGLCNNLVCGILPGENGKYWISTYNGLSCFNEADKSFRNYFEKDGLTHNEFNRFSFYKSPDGTYHFGGMNGVNVFREDNLLPATEQTGMFISEISFFKDGKWNSFNVWDSTKAIVLPAQNRYLSIKVGSFDMTTAAENVFAYRINGLDKDWVMMGNQHEFRFPFLPAGKYTLHIKSAPPNGNWSVKELAIPLIVKEYWYKTGWAYLLYALCLSGLFVFGWMFQKRRLLIEHENRNLKELNAFKSRFFTNVTHEFRTPLTVILGVSEQLEAQIPSSDHKSRLGLIKRNGQNLLRLINEILDLAKLESHTLKLQYVNGDILAYLRYIAESLHSLSNSQNIMLKVESRESSIIMDYDPDRLLQVVHNLLSNAIKFTPSGGRVVMAVDIETGRLKLSVTDNGAGIAAEELPWIFDRFYQAKNQTGKSGSGTGIGLSLTRELVRAMEGEIEVKSTLGKGTVFTVTLPILHTSTEPAVQNPEMVKEKLPQPVMSISEDSPDTGLPRILVMEDNPDVVEYLGFCLQNAYQIEYAFNGRAGIEKAFSIVPDIVISDVMMPEKDGYEVCDTLKHDERTSHIPIVLLTAKADSTSRIAGLRRGADAYLAKPFHPEELMVQLQNLLDLRNKMRAYYAGLPVGKVADSASVLPDLEAQFLQKLRDLINDNMANPKLSQDYICQQMGMSRTNLYRKLMALTDQPLTLFIRDIRLQKARLLLQTTRMNVSEVAYECGFDDPKYFSRVFSEVFGTPPSALRS